MDDFILIDWGAFTLFLFIVMRMSGLVGLNMILAREGVPVMVKGGMVLIFSVIAFSMDVGRVAVPNTTIELLVLLLKEFTVGAIFTLVMNIFFMVPSAGGSLIDTQMGFSMAQIYDPGSGQSLTVTANYFNLLMTMIFFAANGHHTLIRIIITSSELLPYGNVDIGNEAIFLVIELFAECFLLAVKLALPVIAAELLGQVGMGVLMKAIPGINVFVINIDLKVLVGLILTYILLPDITVFLLEVEKEMLYHLQLILKLSSS